MSLKIFLEMGLLAETNDPAGGLVFEKKAADGNWLPRLDKKRTGICIGVEAKLYGKATCELCVTTWSFGAGIDFEVTSKDNTASSRLSYEYTPFAGDGDSPELRWYGAFNGLAIWDARYAQITKKDVADKDTDERHDGDTASVSKDIEDNATSGLDDELESGLDDELESGLDDDDCIDGDESDETEPQEESTAEGKTEVQEETTTEGKTDKKQLRKLLMDARTFPEDLKADPNGIKGQRGKPIKMPFFN